MKPFVVRSGQLAFLAQILIGYITPTLAQMTWTVDSSSWVKDGTTCPEEVYLLPVGVQNGDSINFVADDPAFLWSTVGGMSFLNSLSNVSTDVARQGRIYIPYTESYEVFAIGNIGTIDNPLKALHLHTANLNVDNIYVETFGIGPNTSNEERTVKIDKGMIDNFYAHGSYASSPLYLEIGDKLQIGNGNDYAFLTMTVDAIFSPNGFAPNRIFASNFAFTGQGTLEKFGDGTLSLSNRNTHEGGTIISGGRLIAIDIFGHALGKGDVTLKEGAVLQIGDAFSANRTAVIGDWIGEGGILELYVDRQGAVSSLRIYDDINSVAPTQVKMEGTPASLNLWGATMQQNKLNEFGEPDYLLIWWDNRAGNPNGYQCESAFQFEPLETSRYRFSFEYLYYDTWHEGAWIPSAAPQDVLIPDISTMMLTNIIGFEIPRAQNVDGPWAKMKGGQLNDRKSMFNNNSYQTIQVGWDKRLQVLSCENASWNAGIFMEGDWMYGRGDYRSSCQGVPGNIYGKLSSSTSGMGTGLYISRSNHNNIYFDVAGRINLFENKANMYAEQMPEANNYRSTWSSKTLSLAMELGKIIQSKNGRFTFNPYNQVIYVGAPSNDFDVIFADNSIVNVHTDQVDAWTNKLGGLVSMNFKNKEDRVNRTIFGSMNYYQGLGGRFSTQMLDTLNPNAEWVATNAGRPKNDLSYATGIVGFSLLPKENIRLSTHGSMLFGDVSGWSVSLTGSIGF